MLEILAESDDSFYDQDFRESLVEDDEISAWEECFMKGYDEVT
ncbi:MAG: hypothetical protein V1740_05085 [Candidatus Woesearchaeota archaeon]